MSGGLESFLARHLARWVGAVERRPGFVLAVVGLLTVVLGVYAATHLGINSDPRTLINPDLPFQARQRQLNETFHTLGDGVLVVLDADSPAAAHQGADRLAARLAERQDLFSEVHVPGGGPFFARNALLYLEPDALDDLADRLSAVQPFLAELARDQSLVGVADLLRQALAAHSKGTDIGLDLSTALDRISAAIESTVAGRPAVDPWGTALLGGAMPAEARRRIVALRPKLDYGRLLNAGPVVDIIRQAARDLELTPERGVHVRVTGDPILNHEEWLAIGTQSQVIAGVSFVLFTVAVFFALRSLRVMLALSLSLFVSLVWTNAFAAATVGNLNQISAGFNVFIVGLGGEFGIHACLRYLELIGQGRSRADALTEMASSIGPSLLSSAVTTAIGFYIFLLTDFTGVAQLGLISGTGMFISLAVTLTVLPALLSLGRPAPLPVTMTPPKLIATLSHLPLRYARPIRFAALAVAVGAVGLLPRVRFDYNLLALRDPSSESVSTFEDLLSTHGRSPWTIDVPAPNLPAAVELARKVTALDTVAEARTLRDYVPTDQDEKREVLRDAALFVPPVIHSQRVVSDEAQRAALAALAVEAARTAVAGGPLAPHAQRLAEAVQSFLRGPAATGEAPAALARLQKNIVGSLPDQLRELTPLLTPGEVGLSDLPPELVRQMLAPDGPARIEVVARADLSDSIALERFVDSVRALAPEGTGAAVWMVEWGRVTWGAMLRALLGGLLCIMVFLTVLWRSLWDTLLALFPLVLAAILTCATMVLLGQTFNFANVIVLPMLLGMGIDNGVHLVHRHRTNPDEIDVLATSTARAVFFSAVTTVLSFGSMGFASHMGMAALGRLLTVGVVLTLICYVVVLPSVLEWDDRRRQRGAG